MRDKPTILETSVVAQTLSRIVRDSLVGRALATATRPLRRLGQRAESAVARRFAVDQNTDASVAALVRENRLFQWVAAAFARIESAWRSSVFAAALQPLVDDLRRGGAPYVVRLIGWTMLVGGVTYRAIVGFRDPLLTRGFIVAWIIELVFAAVLIAVPGPIAAAWQSRIAELDAPDSGERR